jgi:hypothetical protein
LDLSVALRRHRRDNVAFREFVASTGLTCVVVAFENQYVGVLVKPKPVVERIPLALIETAPDAARKSNFSLPLK